MSDNDFDTIEDLLTDPDVKYIVDGMAEYVRDADDILVITIKDGEYHHGYTMSAADVVYYLEKLKAEILNGEDT